MKAVATSRRHEHEFEPQRGLPELLPEGERILWQGAPQWRALALRAYHWRKLALYFAVLLAWQAASGYAEGGWAEAFSAWVVTLPLFAGVLAIVGWWAWLSARTACYTLTDRRVVMRIGIVLSVSFNLPYSRIAAADLGLHKRSSVGDLSLRLNPGERIGLIHLWPHARPGAWSRAEPTLRCVADAQDVALTLRSAWVAAAAERGVASGVVAAELARASALPPNGQLAAG
jgi:hypothetical protein